MIARTAVLLLASTLLPSAAAPLLSQESPVYLVYY
jgi:hypothetical protein